MGKRNQNGQRKGGGRNFIQGTHLQYAVGDAGTLPEVDQLFSALPPDQMWEWMQQQFSLTVEKLGSEKGSVYQFGDKKTIDGYFYIEDSMLDTWKKEFERIAKDKKARIQDAFLDCMKRLSTTCIVRPIE